MKIEQTNSGPVCVFSDAEREHWACICGCIPLEKLGYKEGNFVRRMDAKFRGTRGAYLTPAQWQWIQAIAAQWKHLIPDY